MNFDYIFKKHKITEKYIDQIRIYVELSHSSLMSAWRQQGLIVEGCCCCCCYHQVTSVVSDSATPETAAHQAPPSLGFSRQEHWNGLPFPSPMHESEK